jgi:hypothetical protein
MRTFLRILAPLLFCSACAGSLETARDSSRKFGAAKPDPSPHCQGLDRDRANWAAVAAGAAILSGSSGIATLPDTGPEGRIALGITSIAAAVLGGVALSESHAAGEAWARDCAPPPVSAQPIPFAIVPAVPTLPVSSAGPSASPQGSSSTSPPVRPPAPALPSTITPAAAKPSAATPSSSALYTRKP